MRDPVRLAGLLATALALAGCGTDARSWPGPDVPSPDGRLEVASFNEHLSGGGSESDGSPLALATEYLRLEDTSAATTTVVVSAAAEGRGPSRVAVTLDRLLDDSVRALRYELALERTPDGWRLRSATVAQRCWPGRGHTRFSPEPCV
jgi:hypothetical protein